MVNAAQTAIPNWFVVIMGMGTVFVGLICIVLILKLISWVVGKTAKTAKTAAKTAVSGQPDGAAGTKKYDVTLDGTQYEVTLDGVNNAGSPSSSSSLEIFLGE